MTPKVASLLALFQNAESFGAGKETRTPTSKTPQPKCGASALFSAIPAYIGAVERTRTSKAFQLDGFQDRSPHHTGVNYGI